MYTINHQNYDYYSNEIDCMNSNKINHSNNLEHNMYYSSCGKEMWVNNYNYKQEPYTQIIYAPSYSNIYDSHQTIIPIINKRKKQFLESEDDIAKSPCHKLLKTNFMSNTRDSNIQNCSISSCLSPTASVTSSSNSSSSSDELVYESLFRQLQAGSLSKSKYRRLMANERERKRMHGLNMAFENLRSVLPSLGSNKQFSKFET